MSDPAPIHTHAAAAVPAGAAAPAERAPDVGVDNRNAPVAAPAAVLRPQQGPQPVQPHQPQQHVDGAAVPANPVPDAGTTRATAAHTGAVSATSPASTTYLNQRMEGPLCRQSFGITRPMRSQQRDEEGFPGFFIVEAEPGVVVLSDPMAGAAEVRSINVVSIRFNML